MDNIVNLKVGDNRLGEFLEKLLTFIRTEADGLSYPAVLGCIELAKDSIKEKQVEDVIG